MLLVGASLRRDESVRAREACQSTVTSDRSQEPHQKRNPKSQISKLTLQKQMSIKPKPHHKRNSKFPSGWKCSLSWGHAGIIFCHNASHAYIICIAVNVHISPTRLCLRGLYFSMQARILPRTRSGAARRVPPAPVDHFHNEFANLPGWATFSPRPFLNRRVPRRALEGLLKASDLKNSRFQ